MSSSSYIYDSLGFILSPLPPSLRRRAAHPLSLSQIVAHAPFLPILAQSTRSPSLSWRGAPAVPPSPGMVAVEALRAGSVLAVASRAGLAAATSPCARARRRRPLLWAPSFGELFLWAGSGGSGEIEVLHRGSRSSRRRLSGGSVSSMVVAQARSGGGAWRQAWSVADPVEGRGGCLIRRGRALLRWIWRRGVLPNGGCFNLRWIGPGGTRIRRGGALWRRIRWRGVGGDSTYAPRW
jgi:hypothetical protein